MPTITAFAMALKMLLKDGDRAEKMGERALDITIPYFTWEARTSDMLNDLGISPGRESG